jgi:transposase
MITMEMFGKIRRMYWRDKLLLHEIARRTRLSRNTLRRWLREEDVGVPKYRRNEVVSKVSAYHDVLKQALTADAHRNKQNRRTGKDLFKLIKQAGYDGSYSQVLRYLRTLQEAGSKTGAFVPLKFAFGEAFQFDWSEEGLVIGGIYYRLQVSHLKLCASRAF